MVEVLTRCVVGFFASLLFIVGAVGLDAAAEYVTRPSQAEVARRAAEECARTLAAPVWQPAVYGNLAPEFQARVAAAVAVSKFECTYGGGTPEGRRLRERIASLDGSLGEPPEGFAACNARSASEGARIEKMRDGYAKSVALRDWTRSLEGCYDQASLARKRAREAAYLAIIKDAGY